ncbi:MAG: MmcQ/YjbR family DNA-binding protein [Oscillospiraceae bacterium]|nr:MmcQ/YjbR family DNA-binding protein [Oscillospiraceae bacterium]
MTRDELLSYVFDTYSTEAEYPWMDENFIFRHQGSRKWFAVAMRIQYRRLGIAKEGSVDIVDVKCGPFLMGAYRGQPGILPGYHMNKDNWITILLDGTADDVLIKELLQLSYDLTNSRRKTKPHDETAPDAGT